MSTEEVRPEGKAMEDKDLRPPLEMVFQEDPNITAQKVRLLEEMVVGLVNALSKALPHSQYEFQSKVTDFLGKTGELQVNYTKAVVFDGQHTLSLLAKWLKAEGHHRTYQIGLSDVEHYVFHYAMSNVSITQNQLKQLITNNFTLGEKLDKFQTHVKRKEQDDYRWNSYLDSAITCGTHTGTLLRRTSEWKYGDDDPIPSITCGSGGAYIFKFRVSDEAYIRFIVNGDGGSNAQFYLRREDQNLIYEQTYYDDIPFAVVDLLVKLKKDIDGTELQQYDILQENQKYTREQALIGAMRSLLDRVTWSDLNDVARKPNTHEVIDTFSSPGIFLYARHDPFEKFFTFVVHANGYQMILSVGRDDKDSDKPLDFWPQTMLVTWAIVGGPKDVLDNNMQTTINAVAKHWLRKESFLDICDIPFPEFLQMLSAINDFTVKKPEQTDDIPF